jgi:hypothetical protein
MIDARNHGAGAIRKGAADMLIVQWENELHCVLNNSHEFPKVLEFCQTREPSSEVVETRHSFSAAEVVHKAIQSGIQAFSVESPRLYFMLVDELGGHCDECEKDYREENFLPLIIDRSSFAPLQFYRLGKKLDMQEIERQMTECIILCPNCFARFVAYKVNPIFYPQIADR